jgi:hypothetical protein
LVLILTVLAIVFAASLSCWAADEKTVADEQAVQNAKQALSGSVRFPWYDRQGDDVRPLEITPRQPVANRGAKWAAKPRVARTWPRGRWDFLGPVLQWLGITVWIVLLGLVAYLVATAMLSDEASDAAAARRIVESRRHADRVEALPFQLRAAAGDFLGEARRLYEAGLYSEAIVYLFSHELVELDKHHVIRLAKGKTNRQYLRETRQRPTLRTVLEATMIAFEEAFFGNKTLSRDEFERCWNGVDAFQQDLARTQGAAA